MSISDERGLPLAFVLGVLPGARMSNNVVGGALLERDRLCPLKPRRHAGLVLHIDRVEAVEQHLAGLSRPCARLLQRDRVQSSEPHLASATVQHETEQPCFLALLRHLQPKALAVTVATLRLDPRDLDW